MEVVASKLALKVELVEAVDLENRVLELCHETPKGVTDAMIQTAMPQCTVQQRVTAINRLLSTGKIDLLKSGSQLIYRMKDPGAPGQIRGDQQEKVVYQIIKEASNKGIWVRDIRFKSNLVLTQVNKILKNLESKKVIKAVKSVAASKKKVYMLYDLEPDRSVTGGAWYSDQDFESEFVEVLNQQCFKYLRQKASASQQSSADPMVQLNNSFASSLEVCQYIAELGISKVDLSVDDIETILNTLIYDGKVERSIVAEAGTSATGEAMQKKLYRAINCLIEPSGLMRMPCGACPVFNDCCNGGVVSPATCVYMKEWLDC